MADKVMLSWDGAERRTNHRLRQLVDQLNERVDEMYRAMVSLSAQVTLLASELHQLKHEHESEKQSALK
jgi:hypothetical protein